MSAQAWTWLGLLAQGCFFMRFLVQWLQSERCGASVIPTSFWYWSLLGASGLLVYAAHIKDPVFILGQSTGFFIYIRNLMLVRRKHENTYR